MLTKREEIASRLLAGMLANPAIFQVDRRGLIDVGNVIDFAVIYTHDLITKLVETDGVGFGGAAARAKIKLAETNPQPEPARRPIWDDAPEWANFCMFSSSARAWFIHRPQPKDGFDIATRPIAKAGA